MDDSLVAGIDEAGRGPLAGPVVACAVLFQDIHSAALDIDALRDSKQLSPKQRGELYDMLVGNPTVKWGIGKVSEKQIDKINILQATRLAMKKAFTSLTRKLKNSTKPNLAIIDGTSLLDLPIAQKAAPHADSLYPSCMAASIIAKVTRDRLMFQFHKQYPKYGFNRHKGYGTRFHLQMLRQYGPSPIHRMTFRGVGLGHESA